MSSALVREIETVLRTLRQSIASRDMKAFRGQFWTNRGFRNIDASGRVDDGWGPFEELMDTEFRYMESLQLQLKDPQIQQLTSEVATVVSDWRMDQVDPGGREQSIGGRVSFVLQKFGSDWKIVLSHYTAIEEDQG